ncbi:hypothetical protein [Psychroserpens damuponensis]|uniref:hypothetical protein n=1 Tax=Psychroserpens damuponensis TaxID=943936 RepID=UPI00126A52E1|nr:hypothetical protein [Psychroserpens damuponensis]
MPAQQDIAAKNFKVDTAIKKFSISTVDRDPFLGNYLKKETNSIINKKKKTLSWKPIEYLGIVKGDRNSQNIFIVSINGKQYLLRKGQTKDSLTLLFGTKKSLTLSYKNQQKRFDRIQ